MSKNKTVKSFLLYVAFSGLLFLALFNPAYASTCPEAFDSQGKVVVSGAICNEDILANALNIMTGDLASHHSDVADAYKSAGLEPVSFGGASDLFMGMIRNANTSIYTWVLSSFIVLAILTVLLRAFDLIRYGSLYRDGGEVVIDSIWLALSAAMIWPQTIVSAGVTYSVSFGQVFLVKIALFGISIANYLTSMVIVAASGDEIMHKAKPWDTEQFDSVSKIWAGNLVSSVGAMQENAKLVNYYSLATSNAMMIKQDSVSDGSFWGSMSSLASQLMAKIVPYDARDPSVSEVYQGLFEDSTINIVMTAQKSHKDITRTTFELSDDSVVDGKVVSPLFERDLRVNEMFSAANVSTISGVVPDDLDYAIISNIAKSGAIPRIFEKLFVQTETDEEQIREDAKIGGQMIHDLIESQKQLFPDAEEEKIATVIANFLLGSASLQETSKVGGTISVLPIQPFTDEKRLSGMGGTEVLYPIISQAMLATKEFSTYLCYKNVEKAAWEFDMASEWIDGGRDLDTDFDRYSDVPYPYPICTYPDGQGGFTFLMDDEDSKALLEITKVSRESGRSVPLSSHFEQIKSKFDAKRDAKLRSAETEVMILRDYHSRVAASMRWALLEYKRNSQSEYQKELARNQRVKGASAVMEILKGSMSSQSRYQRAFDWKSPVSVANHVEDDGYLPRRPLDEEDYSVRIGQVGRNSMAWDLVSTSRGSAGIEGSGSGLEDDTNVVAEATMIESLARNFGDMAIAGDDELKMGLGLDQELTLGDNLVLCSTVRNCTDIKMAPLELMYVVGIEMIRGVIIIYTIDVVLQKLDNIFSGSDGGSSKGSKSDGGVMSKAKSLLGGFEAADIIEKIPMGRAAGILIKVAATVSGVFANFANISFIAGVAFSIVFQIMSTIAFLKLFIVFLLKFAALFYTLALRLLLSILKIGQHCLVNRGSIIRDVVSILIHSPLIVLAALIFMVSSYASTYMAVSLADGTIGAYRGTEAGGFIGSIIVETLSPIIFMIIQYVSLQMILKLSEDIPQVVLRSINVEVESSDSSTFTQMIGAAAMTAPIQEIRAGFTRGDKMKAMRDKREELKEARLNPPSAASRKGGDDPKSGDTPSDPTPKNNSGNNKPEKKEKRVEDNPSSAQPETKTEQGNNPDSTTGSREE
ncbi:hypothetical protein P3687_22185 [Vibrio parahaemolyticus]|nr:hypothetical protein [Vibrio parahaemolyticus]